MSVPQSELMRNADIPTPDNPNNEVISASSEMSRESQMQLHSPHAIQNGAGMNMRNKIRMKYGKKAYIVRVDKEKKKYIMKNKSTVYLSSIRGQYVYI